MEYSLTRHVVRFPTITNIGLSGVKPPRGMEGLPQLLSGHLSKHSPDPLTKIATVTLNNINNQAVSSMLRLDQLSQNK